MVFIEQTETSDDEEDEDDDNIVVTVPPASAAYKETSGLVRVTQQNRMKEIAERQNVLEESHGNESIQHNSSQFSDSYYYTEHFNDQHITQQNTPFSPDESEKNYMVTIPSTNNTQAPYLPRNMYNQQTPTSQMPIRPAMYGQYPLQPQQQQQQPPPFYPQQQKY